MANEKKTFIKIAGMDIPIHLAWKKITVLREASDVLDRLNEKYPKLSSDFTQDILPIVKHRLDSAIGEYTPPPELSTDFIEYLKQKIKTHAPEDCIDLLFREKNIEINLNDLVNAIGSPLYLAALKREAESDEYIQNKIAPEQIAQIWNDMKRPAPGKDHWVTKDVEKLLGENNW